MPTYNDIQVCILAAGKGSRMQSKSPKVLSLLHGKPLILHILERLLNIGIYHVVVVVGHQKELVHIAVEAWCLKNPIMNIRFAVQEEQKGTGHAVLCAQETLFSNLSHILILMGDVPNIQETTLTDGIMLFHNERPSALIFTTQMDNPTGYGRIVRRDKMNVSYIVEEKDIKTKEERSIKEVNTGALLCEQEYLWKTLKNLNPQNAQNEIYLTDVIQAFIKKNLNVITFLCKFPKQFVGINSQEHLEQVSTYPLDDLTSIGTLSR